MLKLRQKFTLFWIFPRITILSITIYYLNISPGFVQVTQPLTNLLTFFIIYASRLMKNNTHAWCFVTFQRPLIKNNLSNEIRTADSYISFRNAVKKIYFVTPISLPISLKDKGASLSCTQEFVTIVVTLITILFKIT